MGRSLPLYSGSLDSVLEQTTPLNLDRSCTRCPLHAGVRNVCIPGDGAPGGLLLVGEGPGKDEDARGRPFVGVSGKFLRDTVKKLWKGPVIFDNATRCFPPQATKDKVAPKAIAGCRPYLAGTLRDSQATRVVAMGSWAMQSVLGRSVAPLSARRGYAYLGNGVPVFFVLHPAAALRNRFVREWFEADMEWALTATPPMPPVNAKVFLVETPADAEAAIRAISKHDKVAFDVETMGKMFSRGFRIVSFAVCAVGATDSYVWTRQAINDPAVRVPLDRWLQDSRRKKVGQNVKYDVAAVWDAWGYAPQGVEVDVRLWRKLLEPEASARLQDIAELVGMGGHKQEAQDAMDVAEKRVRDRLTWERAEERRRLNPPKTKSKSKRVEPPTLAAQGVPPELEAQVRDPDVKTKSWSYGMLPGKVLYRYNARDAVSTALLSELLHAQIEGHPEFKRIWERVIKGANQALPYVERWGVGVDRRSLDVFDMHLSLYENDAKRRLDGYAPDVLWSSPVQVAEFFFRKLGLTPPKVNEDTGAESVDKEVLTILRALHPAADALLDYRRATKLRGTYAAGMVKHIRDDGRIHPSILLDGATTGRTSCKDPNLQNIPRPRTPEGKMARDIFIAAPGKRFLQLDYSQLELRIAALLSGDAEMLKVFLSGVDYHQRTAELVSKMAWRIEPHEVEKKHRDVAKTFNFGLLYGKTDGSFAEELNITRGEASKIRAAILGNFKDLARWCSQKLAESRHSGVAWTLWDGQLARRRNLWKIADHDDGARINAENSAVNTPIQGTASDYCVASLAAAIQWILDEGIPAKLVLAVHDSLLLEVDECAVDEVADGVRQIMSGWPSGAVPLVVDVEEGDRWGSLEKRGKKAA